MKPSLAFPTLALLTALAVVLYGGWQVRTVSETRGTTLPGKCTVGNQAYDEDNGATFRCGPGADTWYAVAMPPAYGQLYEHSAGTVISITTGGTFVPWVSSTAGESNLTTPAVDTDNITIDSGGAGVYLVSFQVSFIGSATEIFHWVVHVQGSPEHKVGSERKVGAADMGSQSGVGLIALSDADVVDLRVTSTSNTKTATVNHVQLTLTRVGI
jgi:hypothetical protein